MLPLVQHMVHGGGFLIIYLQVHESLYHGKSQSGVVCHGGKVGLLVAEYFIQNKRETTMLHRLLYIFWISALVSASADDGPGDSEFK